MNIFHVNMDDYIDILTHANELNSWLTSGGSTVHIVEYSGSDLLIISDPISGGAIVIDSNDDDYGGSAHEHARRAIKNGTL